jgi:hypothetical protein
MSDRPISGIKDAFYSAQAQAGAAIDVRPCNCIGPQLGERLCPCALRAQAEQHRIWLRDGITINGERYRLVKAEDIR